MSSIAGQTAPRTFSRLAAVRHLALPALVIALGAAAAFGLAACGGGEDAKLLPGETAREITENLSLVRQLASEGECIGAEEEAQEVGRQIDALTGVDAKLKEALQRGSERLEETLVTCAEATAEAPEASTEETTSEAPKTPPGHEKHKVPPGQEKKEEPVEEEAGETTAPEEEAPAQPEGPPAEGGGTGAPGGVSPANPAGGAK